MVFGMIFCMFLITSKKTGKSARNNINIKIYIMAALQQVIQAPTSIPAPFAHA